MTGATAPQSPIRIADLSSGQEVEGVFACLRKHLGNARSGAPFLRVELSDASGRIAARAFRDAEYMNSAFSEGDVVRVVGRVEKFRDQLQLTLRSVARATGDDAPADEQLLPSAYRDLDELDGFLEHLASEVYDDDYRRLLDALLADDTLRAHWRKAPCSVNGHHAYLGGLLEHTVAVATLAQNACELHRRLDSDLLLTAAIVHDLGKIREFEYGARIELSDAGALIGHVTLGVQLLQERIAHVRGLNRDRELSLMHCVLVHHGPPPGKRFGSLESLTLHHVNSLDASVKGALEHGLG